MFTATERRWPSVRSPTEVTKRHALDMFRKRPDESSSLGEPDELFRSNEPVTGVEPARQRLDAGDRTIFEIRLRLVVHRSVPASMASRSSPANAAAGCCSDPAAGHTPRNSILLPWPHTWRRRRPQQRLAVGAVIGSKGDPDAAVHLDGETLVEERTLQYCTDAAGPPDTSATPRTSRRTIPNSSPPRRDVIIASHLLTESQWRS